MTRSKSKKKSAAAAADDDDCEQILSKSPDERTATKTKNSKSKKKSDKNTSRKRKRGKNNWHNDVHDKFRPLTANLRKKNAKLTLNDGLKAANMTLDDLPDVPCEQDDKKGICWKFVLGNCPMGEKCRHVHPPAKEIPESVVSKALPPLTKLVKGLEQCSSQEEEREGQQKTPIKWM